jgi:hypothetical protein
LRTAITFQPSLGSLMLMGSILDCRVKTKRAAVKEAAPSEENASLQDLGNQHSVTAHDDERMPCLDARPYLGIGMLQANKRANSRKFDAIARRGIPQADVRRHRAATKIIGELNDTMTGIGDFKPISRT